MLLFRIFRFASLAFVPLLCMWSCFEKDSGLRVGGGEEDYEIAIPLINSRISVTKIAGVSKGNTAIIVSPGGKISVLYKNNNVLSKTVASVFPPFPGLFPYILNDTLTRVKLPVDPNQLVKKAIFKDTKIIFYFESKETSDVRVTMRIPELTKNNIVFEREFILKYSNMSPMKLQTDQISVDGWTYKSETNTMTFQYGAKLLSGKRIILDNAFMNFDILKFSYIEGYLGYFSFPLDGNIIDVGLFNQWQSGSFDFTDPKITISLDNTFGIPVRSKINKFELTSVTGKTLNLESSFVDSGIDYAYPGFNEIDMIKTTHFEFNKNNSNIQDIFNEKTKTLSYDINALVNPLQDTTIKGYVTDNSYFVVRVAVEVPLQGSVNQVIVADTLDINLDDFKKVKAAEFKTNISNDFPMDIKVQAYFLDENNKSILSLFKDDGLLIPAAPLNSNGTTSPGVIRSEIIDFDSVRFDKVRQSKRLAVVGQINTTGSDMKNPVWIYDNYGINLQVGAKLKLEL